MKRLLLLVAAITVIPAAACSTGVDGFKDEEAKRMVWEGKRCNEYTQASAPIEGAGVRRELNENRVPPSEKAEAEWWADRLSRADTIGDVMQYESSADFQNMCTGWLWERNQKRPNHMDGYDDFTYEDALSAGIVE
ncbi:hypothetical protein SAMN05444817_1033 [Corynebacterium appendicis CIP 107643]|uniref:Lipoprotein n=1 Tax=Corynebacterium appendicis CIP 107643 TaxID=1161099 RepID=A0A1N7IZG9_9CORY|nr:hypothetical protein [Corynebacterium appendicis]WJY61565.1 hypothetical protein CAPP_08285 [Corynebacterium appendicis CIP 107643]SIS42450.1 hypothetical protein SAMN05444817_1033 [Corynebacterium appendicis CIP 107643]